MRIGVIKEIKNEEHRVALTPSGAKVLVNLGHQVLIQKGAGIDSGFSDMAYREAGAKVASCEEAWDTELVIKVKEPLESEYTYLGNQILFTYLHLAGVTRTLTEALLKAKTTAIAYETVEDAKGRLPLLAPMSAVAGNMAVSIGNYYLARFNHGKGALLGRLMGERYGKVVIIGDGLVGRHAARVADGMGANVFICGRHPERLPDLKREISEDIQLILSRPESIAEHLYNVDLVVGAVLLHGAKAPHVVTKEMVQTMEAGSVIVDVSIDQGGCIETSRPTSHSNPVFEKHGVIHYCVTNMPGAYPKTSTIALTSATLPYVTRLAEKGIDALKEDPLFAKGLNTYQGHITCKPVAEILDMLSALREF